MSTLVWVFLILALLAGAWVSHKYTKWRCKVHFKHLIKKYGTSAIDYL